MGRTKREIGREREAYKPPVTYQKSNFMIGAKYRSSLLENKILAISLSNIQEGIYKEVPGGLAVEMKAAELRDMLDSNAGSFYTQLDAVADEMTGRTIGWTDPERKEFDYISVVSRATYKDGVFTVKFNADLLEYMSNIKDNYTILSLTTMLGFKSVYSFRLFELLRARAFYAKGQVREDEFFEINFSVSELRLDLGVVNAELDSVKQVLRESKKHPDYDKAVEKSPEKLFKTWGDFKRRVIDVAVNEINSNDMADMHVDYVTKTGGKGGKVYGICFYVQLNASKHANGLIETGEQMSLEDIAINGGFVENVNYGRSVEPSEDEKILFYMEVGKIVDLPVGDIKKISEVAGYDAEKVRVATQVLEEYKRGHDVVSDTAFIISAIQKGFIPAENTFHNFEETQYDISALERMVLAR